MGGRRLLRAIECTCGLCQLQRGIITMRKKQAPRRYKQSASKLASRKQVIQVVVAQQAVTHQPHCADLSA